MQLRERRDQLRRLEVVEIVVLEAGALRLPDEPVAVLEPRARSAPDRRRSSPSATLRESRRGTCRSTDCTPRCPSMFCRRFVRSERQLSSVGRPVDAIHVVADDVVLERLAVAHVDARRLLRVDVVHEQIDDRIRDARLRVRLDVERILDLRQTRSRDRNPGPCSRRSDSTRASCRRATTTSPCAAPSSSPYTQLAVPYLMRLFSLPSVVI